MDKITSVTNLVICIMVVVILVVTTIIPVIDEASDPETTVFNNEDWYYSNLVGTTGTHTISFDVASETPIISDDVAITIDDDDGRIPVLISDSAAIWPNAAFTALAVFYISSGSIELVLMDSVDITIDAENKTITMDNIVSSGESVADIILTYSDFCYQIGVTGEYAALGATGDPKEFYISGVEKMLSLYAAPGYFVWAIGTEVHPNDPSKIVSLDADLTPVPDYDGVYTAILGGDDNGINFVGDPATIPSVVIVPKTVTVTTYNSYHVLWSVIPIMLLMIPVMLAVRAISGRD